MISGLCCKTSKKQRTSCELRLKPAEIIALLVGSMKSTLILSLLVGNRWCRIAHAMVSVVRLLFASCWVLEPFLNG